MYWVVNQNAYPPNHLDAVVWRAAYPSDFLVARYYETGESMDDGRSASSPGFYIKRKAGRRALLQGVDYFMPLYTPRPMGEAKRKQFFRGYRAAFLRVLAMIEAKSKVSLGGAAWALKALHEDIEEEIRKTLSE